MAKPIIAAIRTRHDLKESVLHTAQELAHRASFCGVVRNVSYTFLAMKCHCCKQTVINHIKLLEERGILRKKTIWVKNNFCEKNVYTFIIPWKKPTTAQTCNGQKSLLKFPTPEKEREKGGSLQENIAKQEKALQFCTPGSIVHQAACDEIARLKAYLPGGDDEP